MSGKRAVKCASRIGVSAAQAKRAKADSYCNQSRQSHAGDQTENAL
jgi:hypothetical protein